MTPVRGGSKGVPRKNLRTICGKPLIAWTIQAAQESKLLDKYVVSTEDAEIAVVAEEWGAEVLWRPEELAADEVPTLPVLQHTIGERPADTLVLLQATSPIRDAGLIDTCIERFQARGADSLATGFNCTYTEYGSEALPRQKIEGYFYDDGNVYVIKASLLANDDRHGSRIERMPLDREQNVEIDDEFDFWLAEQILLKRQTST